MERLIAVLGMLAVVALGTSAHAAQTWKEGTHYTSLAQAQRTTVPAGKVEVMEVFSYGCVHCNGFEPIMAELKRKLPANAQMVFLPASFNPEESWPLFQRAYLTAQSLGVADRAHQGMYDAVWKTGELAIVDSTTQRLKNPKPTLEDAARCYERLTGVKSALFLSTARSFAVEAKMKAADAQVAAMQVPGTPCIVVNGKYRVNMETLGSTGELIDLVGHLVARESAR